MSNLKSRHSGTPSNTAVLLSIALATQGLLHFHMHFRILFHFHENFLLEFHGNYIECNIYAFIMFNKFISCVDCNLPILIKTPVFDLSYNDLRSWSETTVPFVPSNPDGLSMGPGSALHVPEF